MALSLGKSKRIFQCLKSKICVVGLGKNSFWSGWFHHGCPSSMAPLAPTCRNPDAVLVNAATQFATRRFESTKAEKHVDSLCDAEGNQVFFSGQKSVFKVFLAYDSSGFGACVVWNIWSLTHFQNSQVFVLFHRVVRTRSFLLLFVL